jgi:hypothetical protein
MPKPSLTSLRTHARAHVWPGALIIWLISAAAFSIWLSSPTLIDPDAFYHLKMAKLIMRSHGAITMFPWLQFTTLTQSYVDHHFLYHVILVPFIALFGDLVGMKLATISLAAAAITSCYVLLRHLSIRAPWLWTMLLLFNYSYAFRIGLSKATGLASLLLLIGFLLMATKRWRWLVIWSFVYVWAYGGWPLLLVVAGLFTGWQLVPLLYGRLRHRLPLTRRGIIATTYPLLATISGVMAGLLINPAFPHHLQFYWQQIVEIGLVNYSNIIEVGGEWYSTPVTDLLISQLPITLLFIGACVVAIITHRKQSPTTWVAGSLSILFIIFTLIGTTH